MNLLSHYLLTVLIFLPSAGGAARPGGEGRVRQCAALALASTLLTFGVSLLLLRPVPLARGAGGPAEVEYAYRGAEPASASCRWSQQADWIPAFHVQYKVGIDGLSLAAGAADDVYLRARLRRLLERRAR